MVVPANPGSVMKFYWRDLVVENVSLSRSSRSHPCALLFKVASVKFRYLVRFYLPQWI